MLLLIYQYLIDVLKCMASCWISLVLLEDVQFTTILVSLKPYIPRSLFERTSGSEVQFYKGTCFCLSKKIEYLDFSNCQNSVVSCMCSFWENSLARYLAFEELLHFRVLLGNIGIQYESLAKILSKNSPNSFLTKCKLLPRNFGS